MAFYDMSAYTSDKDAFALLARAAKAHGAKIEKQFPDDPERHFSMVAKFGPVAIRLHTERATVCERVVVETREITEEVPDPEALAAVPTVTVTRTEEVVEWQCKPLLAAEAVSS
jgi:hypothetical protein